MFRLASSSLRTSVLVAAVAVAGAATLAVAGPGTGGGTPGETQMDAHRSSNFTGIKANTGFVTHSTVGGKSVLTLSDDFKVPETPAPHWQVVDSNGNRYLLNRLMIDGNKFNKSIVVPGYVPNVVKVEIWCAYAEVLLGEASFDKPVK